MITYKCSAACRFCYYNCSPEKDGLMPVRLALDCWAGLKNLAQDKAKIHLTGGEVFLYWEHLKKILTEADKKNLGTVDLIETNGFWATDEKIIKERIRFLDCYGMETLKVSYDHFHAEFIDFASVRRLVDTARELLGPDRVRVRWEKYLERPFEFQGLSEEQIADICREALADSPCRFSGRAALLLGPLAADKTVEQISRWHCKKSFLSAKGVHIDPHGNVFSGLCSGIIIANARQKKLDAIWETLDFGRDEIICSVFEGGPAKLMEIAVKFGYKKRRLYAGKCHLCTELRQFFFDKQLYKEIIGPEGCYNAEPNSK